VENWGQGNWGQSTVPANISGFCALTPLSVRGSVEETLNAMLDAEADALCGAQRYERSLFFRNMLTLRQ